MVFGWLATFMTTHESRNIEVRVSTGQFTFEGGNYQTKVK